MGCVTKQLLSTTDAGDGGWFNLAPFSQWSLYVQGMEVGGSLQVLVSNWTKHPDTLVDGEPVDTGAVLMNVGDSGNNIYPGTSYATWLKVVKTPGGSPSLTTVCLAGLCF